MITYIGDMFGLTRNVLNDLELFDEDEPTCLHFHVIECEEHFIMGIKLWIWESRFWTQNHKEMIICWTDKYPLILGCLY